MDRLRRLKQSLCVHVVDDPKAEPAEKDDLQEDHEHAGPQPELSSRTVELCELEAELEV